MKTRPAHRPPGGFTLVELLVVISIIIVLAAMAFGAANLALGKAKRTEALTVETSIEQAIKAYYSEYGKLPSVGTNTDKIDTVSESGRQLITVLLGKEESSSSMQNPRQMTFLTVKEGKSKKGGLIYNKSGTGSGSVDGIYDPWGQPYYIVMDTDYDDDIDDPLKPGTKIHDRKCVVYSLGADKKQNTADDVKTWVTATNN